MTMDIEHGQEIKKEAVVKSPDFSRVVLMIRGVSGSGKSTAANYFKYIHMFGNPQSTVQICEADQFMIENGQYVFKPEKLGKAHIECREKFKKALENSTNLVIVSNTNTTEKETALYINMARHFNYTIFSFVVENINDTKDTHDVPQETRQRQANNLKQSIKLI